MEHNFPTPKLALSAAITAKVGTGLGRKSMSPKDKPSKGTRSFDWASIGAGRFKPIVTESEIEGGRRYRIFLIEPAPIPQMSLNLPESYDK